MRRTAAPLAAGLTLFALVAAGCANDPDGGSVTDQSPPPAAAASPPSPEPTPEGSPSGVAPSGRTSPPPLSSTDLPTLRPPSGPPQKPTDQLPDSIVTGLVVRGGNGPCFGVQNDDGKLYALHSSEGVRLQEGTFVRVKVEPLLLRINCGPGEHHSIVEVMPVR
ncbi:hypothetical protein [Polymorphospora sp. NPDC050346]|uniref:hypothetical protein n=1 Tax=Polymorphospora sp. NPDC050346 TaxID=3155780 RepID=UPI00340EF6CB